MSTLNDAWKAKSFVGYDAVLYVAAVDIGWKAKQDGGPVCIYG
jgi:hypothetical protein